MRLQDPHPPGRAARILLVEDDPGDTVLTRRALDGGGIPNECHVVRDGEEALAYLKRLAPYDDPKDSPAPDLVLLDLNLPRVDGKTVLREIRADERLRSLIVIVLSTSGSETDVADAYRLGSNTYIRKPMGASNFMEMIRTLEDYWFRVALLPDPIRSVRDE
ncbi:response regulator [bacterium]|nr:response regulator [bacterium]